VRVFGSVGSEQVNGRENTCIVLGIPPNFQSFDLPERVCVMKQGSPEKQDGNFADTYSMHIEGKEFFNSYKPSRSRSTKKVGNIIGFGIQWEILPGFTPSPHLSASQTLGTIRIILPCVCLRDPNSVAVLVNKFYKNEKLIDYVASGRVDDIADLVVSEDGQDCDVGGDDIEDTAGDQVQAGNDDIEEDDLD